jgi:hypothetical protein
MLDDGGTVEARNVGEPRRGPEPLQRPRYAGARRGQWNDAPEARITEDGGESDLGGGIGGGSLLLLRDDKENEQRHDRRRHCQDGKEAAPADALNQQLGRAGRGDGAERTQHDVPAVGKRDVLGRKPGHDSLEARDQPDSDAKADERATEEQHGHAIGKGEHESAGSGSEEQGAVDKARSVAIEAYAAREDDRREHQEIHRGQETEVSRARR